MSIRCLVFEGESQSGGFDPSQLLHPGSASSGRTPSPASLDQNEASSYDGEKSMDVDGSNDVNDAGSTDGSLDDSYMNSSDINSSVGVAETVTPS